MTTRFLNAVLALALVAPAAAAGQSVDDIRIKTKVKVRQDWAARYQESRQGPEQIERFTRTAKLGRTGAFEISNIAGSIRITGGSGDEVRIEAVKRVRHRQESNARELLDALRIEVVELPNRVEVRTVYPRNTRNISASVDYTVNLPTDGSATVRTVSGDVRVTNVRGELRAESVSGDVVASGANRISMMKSVSGDVEVNDAASEGAVTLSTVSGDATVRGLKARSLDVGSVSGDVILTDVTCERANVRAVSGNIEYAGPLARSGRYEMNSHSGTVRLAISGNTGFELEATTFSGSVRSDVPLTLRAGAEQDAARGRGFARQSSRGMRHTSIRGTYGDASAIVNLKSFSGDVVVTKR